MKSYTMRYDRASGKYIVQAWAEHFIFGSMPVEAKNFDSSSEAESYMNEKLKEQM